MISFTACSTESVLSVFASQLDVPDTLHILIFAPCCHCFSSHLLIVSGLGLFVISAFVVNQVGSGSSTCTTSSGHSCVFKVTAVSLGSKEGEDNDPGDDDTDEDGLDGPVIGDDLALDNGSD